MADNSIVYDEDHRYEYMTAVLILTVISVLVAWLRVWVRVILIKNPGPDDWTMLFATFMSILTNAFLMRSYKLGLGRHVKFIAPDQLTETFKFLWMLQATNMFALYFIRLSISLSFLRIVPKSRNYLRAFIWATIVALTASTMHITVVYSIQCIPIQKVWSPDIPGWCMDQVAYQTAPWIYQAASILTDVIIVGIAISLFAKLQVALRTRIIIIVLCSMGVFTCVCAVIKTAMLPVVFDSNPDKTWTIALLGIFAALEISVGMICGCIPCLRPLIEPAAERISSARKNMTWSYGSSRNSNMPSKRSAHLNSASTVSEKGLTMHMGEIQKTTEIELSTQLRSESEKHLPSDTSEDLVFPIHTLPSSSV